LHLTAVFLNNAFLTKLGKESTVILAAGLTPAVQQILVFENFRPGNVNRAKEAHLCASGKVINVGLALHHLGGPAHILSILGGPGGESIDREIRERGIPCSWVWAGKPTRMCTTLIDMGSSTTTELVENANPVAPSELDRFLVEFENAAPRAGTVVLSGSFPAGTPKTYYRTLIERSTAPVILDASGQELLEALPAKPFCIKPNREELSRALGRDLHSDRDLRSAMEEMCSRGAAWTIVSHGADALWACDGKRMLLYRPLKIAAVNPIGSGDCLAAGIAWALSRGKEMPDAITTGIAAAADNASMLLPARLNPEKVRRMAETVRCEEA
jgi:tagatose 6-phosphate kinase